MPDDPSPAGPVAGFGRSNVDGWGSADDAVPPPGADPVSWVLVYEGANPYEAEVIDEDLRAAGFRTLRRDEQEGRVERHQVLVPADQEAGASVVVEDLTRVVTEPPGVEAAGAAPSAATLEARRARARKIVVGCLVFDAILLVVLAAVFLR